MTPVVFLVGPSGTGKTTLGDWLAADLNLLHLEIDRLENERHEEMLWLQANWDLFLRDRDAAKMAAMIRERAAAAAGRAGAVLSFPSIVLFEPMHIDVLGRAGIRPIILYGSPADCLAGFLRREQKVARGLDEAHWRRHNEGLHATYDKAAYAPHRLDAFMKGAHRSRAELVAEIKARLDKLPG